MTPLVLAACLALPVAVPTLVETYVERYFQTFPTRATEAGRHDLDTQLPDLSAARIADWLRFNRQIRASLQATLAGAAVASEDRLDADVLLAQIEREIHDLDVLQRPQRDPLYWTSLVASATVFLLVRDDVPLAPRLTAACARARLLPRLAAQARQALEGTPVDRIAPEPARIAAAQARASAVFYRDGFPTAGAGTPAPDVATLPRDGETAAKGLDELAAFLEGLAARATGTPRLGADYAATFRVGTGIEDPVDTLLAEAETALAAKRAEAATYGREVWPSLLPGESPPGDERALLLRLFERVAADRDNSLDSYVAGWQANVRELDAFLRANDVVSLPDPLTLKVDRSPAFFVGQSVGGVYPAGPYSPESPTLLFLPVPPETATPEGRGAFFRDFNRHFNRMIAPHELLPGHYLQLKYAARHPHRLRALFPDPVYVEGWGTFCERLMLDRGWGGPLDRLAHLKKQLENVARTIVDVRVHTRDMTRDELLRFVRDEALQDEQFAANMWVRAITSSPQLTTYHLGYRQVMGLYEEVRRARGPAFRLREFMDGMMTLGPVPVRHYRERMLGPVKTP